MIKALKLAFVLAVFVFITGFSWGGKIGEAMKLAVHCETDEAVAVITEGEGDGLLGAMAILEHESILREAGRDREADAVRSRRESAKPDMTAQEKAYAEKSVHETVAAIRKELEKRTGNATCN